jgi:hypothetical protein
MVSSKCCDKLVHTARYERASECEWVSECATYMGIVFSKFKQTQSVNISNGWLIITIVITPWAKLRISSTASNPFFMNSFSYTQEIVQLHTYSFMQPPRRECGWKSQNALSPEALGCCCVYFCFCFWELLLRAVGDFQLHSSDSANPRSREI